MVLSDYMRLGIARNNARALLGAFNYPTLIFRQSIPTGSFYQEQIIMPKSAQDIKLKYLLFSYPVTAGMAREIFFEAIHERTGFVNVDLKDPATSLGAKGSLFSSPGVDTTPATAAVSSQYVGMMPIDITLPGLAVLVLNIRGALATPNPDFINLLFVGQVKAKGGLRAA